MKLERPLRPLVIITSNRERDMPPAFLRRCVAVELDYPSLAELETIALHHVPTTAELVKRVRERLVPQEPHHVSPAEFVDAVRAAVGLGLTDDSPVWDDVRSIVFDTERRR